MNQRISDLLKDPAFMEKVANDYIAQKKASLAQAWETYRDPRWPIVMAYFVNNPTAQIDTESLAYMDALSSLAEKHPLLVAADDTITIQYLCDVFNAFNELEGEPDVPMTQQELASGEYVTVFDDKIKVCTIIGQGSISMLSAYTAEDKQSFEDDHNATSDAIHEVKIDPRWASLRQYLQNNPEVELQHESLATLVVDGKEISTEFQELAIGARNAIVRILPNSVRSQLHDRGYSYIFEDNLVLDIYEEIFTKKYRLRAARPNERVTA